MSECEWTGQTLHAWLVFLYSVGQKVVTRAVKSLCSARYCLSFATFHFVSLFLENRQEMQQEKRGKLLILAVGTPVFVKQMCDDGTNLLVSCFPWCFGKCHTRLDPTCPVWVLQLTLGKLFFISITGMTHQHPHNALCPGPEHPHPLQNH